MSATTSPITDSKTVVHNPKLVNKNKNNQPINRHQTNENKTFDYFCASARDLQRETYKLEATAQDKGYPPLSRSVEVQIDVVDRANNPPVWDHVIYGPIFIRENLPVGAKVVSVKARSVPPM